MDENKSCATHGYSIHIEWSSLDDALLVTLPEWESRTFNPVTHGASWIEAYDNALIAIDDLVAVTLERGASMPVPSPITFAPKP